MSDTVAADILARLAATGVVAERLSSDSRRVRPGDVFLAMPGSRDDGRRFIADAVRRGAVAVLWERDGFAWDATWLCPNLPVAHLRGVSGYLAHRVYGRPSTRLGVVGITGTNGKTTCSHWLAASFARRGEPCAIIGTLGNGFPGSLEASSYTTPDALAVHASLSRYGNAGAQRCAMEVSSIGLVEERCNGVVFDVAVLTNLTRDHLDYHGTMQAYAEAKRQLFAWPGLRVAVLNLDDAFGRELLTVGAPQTRCGYTLDARTAAECAFVLHAEAIEHHDAGVRFRLQRGSDAVAVAAAVVGHYNVANLLAVAATLLATGAAFAELPDLLAPLVPPPGRMQRFTAPGMPLIIVDYAHTPDALAVVLATLRSVADSRGGRLAVVFGCGGDRDAGKRPLMGELATRLADRVCLTSDNPRHEDPLRIIEDIRRGAPQASIEADRPAAIRAAIAAAAASDVVLVAGKGHETYQEIAGVRHPYSDSAIVRQVLAAPRGQPT